MENKEVSTDVGAVNHTQILAQYQVAEQRLKEDVDNRLTVSLSSLPVIISELEVGNDEHFLGAKMALTNITSIRTGVQKKCKQDRDNVNAIHKKMMSFEKNILENVVPAEDTLKRYIKESEEQAELNRRKAILPERYEELLAIGLYTKEQFETIGFNEDHILSFTDQNWTVEMNKLKQQKIDRDLQESRRAKEQAEAEARGREHAKLEEKLKKEQEERDVKNLARRKKVDEYLKSNNITDYKLEEKEDIVMVYALHGKIELK